MLKFQPGDYVKAEFMDEETGKSERMWVQVIFCDDDATVLFGRLDNEPLLGTSLHLGDELAVSYDNCPAEGRDLAGRQRDSSKNDRRTAWEEYSVRFSFFPSATARST